MLLQHTANDQCKQARCSGHDSRLFVHVILLSCTYANTVTRLAGAHHVLVPYVLLSKRYQVLCLIYTMGWQESLPVLVLYFLYFKKSVLRWSVWSHQGRWCKKDAKTGRLLKVSVV